MLVLKIIFLILNLLLFINGFHFVFFALLPFFKKEKKMKDFKPKTRFLILIAARNEELVIPDLIDSIKSQNYPKELVKTYVLPNNCFDKTKEVSIKHGAMILEPEIKVNTKGEVLNYAFKYFQDKDFFDAYLILDADNILHPNFLKEVNNSFLNGEKVVQGFRDSKNLYDNAISCSHSLFFYLQNLFLNETRQRISQSANINGTGYAFLKEIPQKINYKAKTLTEDIEFTATCAINGIKIGYNKKACFYDEQATSLKVSIKQRKRWVQGTIQVFKNYYIPLLKSMQKKLTLNKLDIFFILIAPFMQILTLISTILANIIYFNIYILISSFLALYLATSLVSLFLIKYYQKNIYKALPGIFYFAIFNIFWIPISIFAFLSNKNNWDEIKHTKSIKMQELLEKN